MQTDALPITLQQTMLTQDVFNLHVLTSPDRFVISMQRLPWRRLMSTLTHHPSTADRELAMPLVFLTSKEWSGDAPS